MTTVDTTSLRDAVATPRTGRGKTIREVIEEQMPQLRRALPEVLSAERFARLVLTEIRRTPKLAECEPASLIGAMFYAAQLGLEPGPLQHCFLIPFKRQVTFMLGFRGILELARRSGEILDIQARPVFENDQFSFSYGLNDRLDHTPALGNPGSVVAFYGVARFKDGGHYFLVLSKEDVDKRRARSNAKESGPWVTDYVAMGCKSVVRAMAAYLPLTAEAATAFAQDERINARFDPDARDEPLSITELDDEPEAIETQVVGAGEALPVGEPDDAESAPALAPEHTFDAESDLVKCLVLDCPNVASGSDGYCPEHEPM